MTYETIRAEARGRVGLLTLHRPDALNALNARLAAELVEAAEAFDRDPAIGCLLLTGSERAFAAGADIKEMQHRSFQDMYGADPFTVWDRFTALRLPVVAAVGAAHLAGSDGMLALLQAQGFRLEAFRMRLAPG